MNVDFLFLDFVLDLPGDIHAECCSQMFVSIFI